MSEENQFDNFMEDLLQKEEVWRERQRPLPNEPKESPQRKYQRLYSEHWQNRIIWKARSH